MPGVSGSASRAGGGQRNLNRKRPVLPVTEGIGLSISDVIREALADDFTGVGNREECFRVGSSDVVAEFHRLRTAEDGDNHKFFFMRVGTGGAVNRCAADELIGDVFADGSGIGADDGEYLAEIDSLDDTVDDKALCGQTAYGVQTGCGTEEEECGDGNHNIHKHQSCTDIETGVFLNDHGDDVGTAAGCIAVKKDGGRKSGKSNRKDQFQERFFSQRCAHGEKKFHGTGGEGNYHGDICCFCAEGSAEHHNTEEHQREIEDQVEGCLRQGEQAAEDDGKTGDTAEREMVGEFEHINTYGHQKTGQGKNGVFFQRRQNF